MTKENYVREVQHCQGSMYRVALTILRNDDDVRDALQEAALKAWEKRHTLREEAYFGTWMTRIVINVCHQMHRKRKREVLMDELPEAPQPFSGLTLRLVLETLPEQLRLPLVLKCVEGMSDEEVAGILHLTQSAVRSRIHRARVQLRKELGEHE